MLGVEMGKFTFFEGLTESYKIISVLHKLLAVCMINFISETRGVMAVNLGCIVVKRLWINYCIMMNLV